MGKIGRREASNRAENYGLERWMHGFIWFANCAAGGGGVLKKLLARIVAARRSTPRRLRLLVLNTGFLENLRCFPG
jgi:hypothetical protein